MSNSSSIHLRWVRIRERRVLEFGANDNSMQDAQRGTLTENAKSRVRKKGSGGEVESNYLGPFFSDRRLVVANCVGRTRLTLSVQHVLVHLSSRFSPIRHSPRVLSEAEATLRCSSAQLWSRSYFTNMPWHLTLHHRIDALIFCGNLFCAYIELHSRCLSNGCSTTLIATSG